MILKDSETLQHTPKYFQIYRDLLGLIRSGRLQPGSILPAETVLCKQYQASRGTVRRGLEELERQGLISRFPGRPTRVNVPKIPLLASGFRADIANKGHSPKTTILFMGESTGSSTVSDLLGISHGSSLYTIQRIVLADNDPVVLEYAYMPFPVDSITAEEVDAKSLLELIPAKRQMVLGKATESYTPTVLTKEEADPLRVKPGALALRDQAVVFDPTLHPIYVSIAFVRGDKAAIVTETVYNMGESTGAHRDKIVPKE